jgi:hypothetical protein
VEFPLDHHHLQRSSLPIGVVSNGLEESHLFRRFPAP